MAEKERLVVCDALDERDFLRKKIMREIEEAKFVGSHKLKDTKVGGKASKAEFEKEAKSSYSRIKDLISRYQRLDIALTLSNATTDITTRSGKTMTRAAAIALRKQLLGNSTKDSDFTGALIEKIRTQYEEAQVAVARLNSNADAQAEKFKDNLTNKETGKLDEDSLKAVNKLVEDQYGELVDPLDMTNELKKLVDDYDNLVKELESAIKVSNATTYVEF